VSPFLADPPIPNPPAWELVVDILVTSRDCRSSCTMGLDRMLHWDEVSEINQLGVDHKER
jgi:hypothetical protein